MLRYDVTNKYVLLYVKYIICTPRKEKQEKDQTDKRRLIAHREMLLQWKIEATMLTKHTNDNDYY